MERKNQHIRTDLALEAHQLWQQNAQKTTELPGVVAREGQREGFKVTTVEILDSRGQEALGKPQGRYVTLELGRLTGRGEGFAAACHALARELGDMLHLSGDESVMVVGLGNTAITPDAVGPEALDSLIVTRHLREVMPGLFDGMRRVSALCPGVLASTGVESAEIVRGVVERTRPHKVIVVDALAARSPDRLCTTLQLADSGITPGSGVGNARAAFNRDSLGVPVIAVGVPTVVDAATFAADMCDKVGNDDVTLPQNEPFMVTTKDIDADVKHMAKLIGYGINLALHDGFELEDVISFLE